MSLRYRIHKAILNSIHWTGADRVLSPIAAGAGAILTFHRVRAAQASPFAPNSHLEVTPGFLGALVDHLRRRGRDIVTLDEALQRLHQPVRKRFAVLTFDDGYRDNLTEALPVLRNLGAPFTVYVAPGMIDRAMNPWWMVLEEIVAKEPRVSLDGRPGPLAFETGTAAQKAEAYGRLSAAVTAMDEDLQREAADNMARRYGIDPAAILDAAMMNWDEVRRLAAEPLVTIGAHTVGHYALAKLPLARAELEVVESARLIAEKIGTRPRHFAYPYGYSSAAGEREFALLANLGFASAVRTVPGTLATAEAAHPTAFPRISVNGHFQRTRYIDALISGAPFAMAKVAARLRGRGGRTPAGKPATAAASRR